MTADNFKKLKEKVEKDLTWTKETAQDKLTQLSLLHSRYLDFFIRQAKIKKELDLEKDKIYGNRFHHYRFENDHSLSTKAEVDIYIRSDDEYYIHAKKCAHQDIVVQYLEEVLKRINTIGFDIKSFIELEKLKKGLI